MAWKITFAKRAKKEFSQLPLPIKKRIDAFWETILADPRQTGTPLTGNLKGIWRYRVGDYRIFCELRDNILTVVVLEVGHRRDIYR